MTRPKAFQHFVGQRAIIGRLRRLIAGARALHQACPSMMFAGASGMGKTALAGAVALEYGSAFQAVFASSDTSPTHLAGILAGLNVGDVLLLDEAHSLREDSQQVLYTALDAFKVPAPDEGRPGRTTLISIAEVTLILATDQPGKIKRALRRRLGRFEFVPYSVSELVLIGKRVAADMGVEITPQAARRLAEVAQGVPDRVRQRLADLRLYYPSQARYTQEQVEQMLADEGVDADGLRPHQRHYLSVLAQSPRGTCSLTRLSVALGCDGANIVEEIEPGLMRLGLVDIVAGAGRTLTAAGRVRAALGGPDVLGQYPDGEDQT